MRIASILFAGFFLLFSCKNEPKGIHIDAIVDVESKDSLIILEVMQNDLLFNMTYTLLEGKKPINYFDSLHLYQKTISKLVSLDSIPNVVFQPPKSKRRKWYDSPQYSMISDSLNEEIFRDSYLWGGKVDNYKVLEEITSNEGLIIVSEMSYSEDNLYALLYMRTLCGWSCGQTAIRLYKKQNSAWSNVMSYVLSES